MEHNHIYFIMPVHTDQQQAHRIHVLALSRRQARTTMCFLASSSCPCVFLQPPLHHLTCTDLSRTMFAAVVHATPCQSCRVAPPAHPTEHCREKPAVLTVYLCMCAHAAFRLQCAFARQLLSIFCGKWYPKSADVCVCVYA